MIKHKSTEFMTFSMCVATFVVSLLWTIYGQLVQDNFILVSMEVPNCSSVIMSKKQSAHARTGSKCLRKACSFFIDIYSRILIV